MENTKITLESLNKGGSSEFIGALGDVFENCPWLVARTSSARPFDTKEALIAALLDEMNAASSEEKLQLNSSGLTQILQEKQRVLKN